MGTGSAALLGGRGSSSPSERDVRSQTLKWASLIRQSFHQPHHRKCRLFLPESRLIFIPPTHPDVFSTSHLAASLLAQPACLLLLYAGPVLLHGHSFLFSLEAPVFLRHCYFSCRPQGCGLLLSVAPSPVSLQCVFLASTQPISAHYNGPCQRLTLS